MPRNLVRLAVLAAALAGGCAHVVEAPQAVDPLVGAWRSQVRFSSGAFAAVGDLEFMLAFNAGGTLTESSNYDGAPPVPPAYGAWRRTGAGRYEAVYEFYATKAPAGFDAIARGGGWLPAGHGRLVERITLAPDGRSYASTLTYTAFDAHGQPAAGGGEATGRATRIGF